jgi:quinol-cytochrome oxidoreductase complex cytochrome b subunit
MGLHAMVLGPGLVFLFLLAVPLVDRGPDRGPGRRVVATIGIVLVLAAAGLGLYAAIAPAQQHLGM